MEDKKKAIKVAALMTRDIFIVKPEDTLERVDELFKGSAIHHLPVVEKSGSLVGLISKTDFMKVNHMFALFDKRFESYNLKLYQSMRVKEIMTEDVICVTPDEPLSVVIKTFKENLFHALPVVENDTLVGIVTTYDLLTYCYDEEKLLEKGS